MLTVHAWPDVLCYPRITAQRTNCTSRTIPQPTSNPNGSIATPIASGKLYIEWIPNPLIISAPTNESSTCDSPSEHKRHNCEDYIGQRFHQIEIASPR